MRGKKEKKEKRYFCDWFEKVIDNVVLLVIIVVVICISVTGINYIAINNYIVKQEKYIYLSNIYSDAAYEELKKDIQNQLEKGGRIEEVVDSYEGSYDGEKTILKCSKTNDNGFVVKITVTTSKNGKILSMDNQFKSKEEYVKETKSDLIWGEYSFIWCGLTLFIIACLYVLLGVLRKISKKHKEKDEEQQKTDKSKNMGFQN